MKKLFSAIALAATVSFGAGAQAQSVAYNYYAPVLKNASILSEVNKGDASISYYAVNMKVMRDFITRYTDGKEEEWHQANDGLIASFVENGIETKVAYNKKNKWCWTMRTLDETQLPFEVRNIAKSKYYDFNIVIAFEINYESGVTYIVKIIDKTQLKVLKIHAGEMEVTEDYTRG